MPKVDSFRMVATMLSLCSPLIGTVIDVVGKFTPTCQGIVSLSWYLAAMPPLHMFLLPDFNHWQHSSDVCMLNL